jgi:hypothetical protein
MPSTVIARTASGSCYVLSIDESGARWFRVPRAGAMAQAATGWEAHPPMVAPGVRLLLGPFRSSPVTEVAYIPEPSNMVSTAREAWAGGIVPWLMPHSH